VSCACWPCSSSAVLMHRHGINGSGLGHLRRAGCVACVVVSTVGVLVMSESAPCHGISNERRFPPPRKYKSSGVKSRLV
jgi:hypothetical protein